jgi:DNA-binding PadR family transcriptional regulator
MPTTDRTPGELPSEELVMAAIERAELHRSSNAPGVLRACIVEHLGMPHTWHTSRRIGPALHALSAAGLIDQPHRQGLKLWGLTSRGRERLEAAHRAGTVGALPESPQHQAWREAHDAAVEHIDGLRRELRRTLEDVANLLKPDRETDSDTWIAASEGLQRNCWRVGAATYCLHEWSEPDDSRADIDESGRTGRCNLRNWWFGGGGE